MLPDRVSNPGPLTYESGALPMALRGPRANGNKGVTTQERTGFRAKRPEFLCKVQFL